jgi:predicted GNAT superfamily acetyltransferase
LKLLPDFQVTILDKKLSRNTLSTLYSLNQENSPEVGFISSIEYFSKLFEMSALSLLVEHQAEIVGFIICFRENSEYESLNYKYFDENKQRFLYIDRVVIKSAYRRKGLGTKIYKDLDEIAQKDMLLICCEVNSIPLNQISLDFHGKNGFLEVGERNFEDHSVKYLVK